MASSPEGFMAVTVVTDSAATLPSDLVEELGIVVVPLRIDLDGVSYRDGELAPEVLLEHPKRVTTSGPTPADFLDALESATHPDGAVILTVSHDIAESTFLAARAAARLAPVPTRVVDTATAAGGEGLVVLAAARRAASGGSLDEVERAARQAANGVRLVATLPSLDHLVRSGHVPEAAAWAARWVGLQPVIELRRGRIRPLTPALSGPAARKRMIEAWLRSRPTGPARLHLAVLHSAYPEGARELFTEIRRLEEPATAFIGPFGTAMLVHSGPGVLGMAWWWEGQG